MITRAQYVRMKSLIHRGIIQIHAVRETNTILEDEIFRLRFENLKHEGEYDPEPIQNKTRISGEIEDAQKSASSSVEGQQNEIEDDLGFDPVEFIKWWDSLREESEVVRYLKGKVETCQGFVLDVRNDGIQVFVPKYSLKSIIVLQNSSDSNTIIDIEDMSVRVDGEVVIRELEPVTVRISVNEKNQQRPRVELSLVKPEIPGLSVDFDLSTSEGLGL